MLDDIKITLHTYEDIYFGGINKVLTLRTLRKI